MTIHEAADGKAVLSMPFLFDLAQGGGLMHGGALVSLADTALVMAIKSLVPPDTPFVTASFEARYLRPFDRGTATAKAHVHHHEGRSFLGVAMVFDEDGTAGDGILIPVQDPAAPGDRPAFHFGARPR